MLTVFAVDNIRDNYISQVFTKQHITKHLMTDIANKAHRLL